MWARFRRRSMAPRRPVLFDSQLALALVTALALLAGVGGFVYLVVRLAG